MCPVLTVNISLSDVTKHSEEVKQPLFSCKLHKTPQNYIKIRKSSCVGQQFGDSGGEKKSEIPLKTWQRESSARAPPLRKTTSPLNPVFHCALLSKVSKRPECAHPVAHGAAWRRRTGRSERGSSIPPPERMPVGVLRRLEPTNSDWWLSSAGCLWSRSCTVLPTRETGEETGGVPACTFKIKA